MGEHIAAIIGIESNQNVGLRTPYARADALAMSVALHDLGFSEERQLLLIDEHATAANIESRLTALISALGASDKLIFFFAGHGVRQGKIDYLLCYDSDIHNLPLTAIPLSTLLGWLTKSACKQIILFLDACNSGMQIDESMQSVLSNMDSRTLGAFTAGSDQHVCFSPSQSFQSSWGSQQLGHGIWTHHLLRALGGEELEALQQDHLMTSQSLQRYLSKHVPVTVRMTYAGKTQTPYLFGADSRDLVIANVSRLTIARGPTRALEGPVLKQIEVAAEDFHEVKRLAGFDKKKGHFIPTNAGGAAAQFIAKLTIEDVQADLNGIAKAIRAAFDYTRKQIVVEATSGGGTVIAPGFEYTLSVALDSDDPRQVVWRRSLRDVSQEMWANKHFDAIFAGTFDTFHFAFSNPIDVEGLIDRVESMRSPTVKVFYSDTDLSNCRIDISGFDGEVLIDESSMRMVLPNKMSPAMLLQNFKKAQSLFLERSGSGLPLGLETSNRD